MLSPRLALRIGGTFLFLLVGVALFCPRLAPKDPNAQGDLLLTRYRPPSWEHPFGTDKFGRDVFSRVLYGSRISLALAVTVVMLSVGIGTVYGGAAAYLGGVWDQLLMRFVDLLLAFPFIFLAVTCVAFFGTSPGLLVLILACTSWMDVARLVRAEILGLKQREFFQAALALGLHPLRILFRHLLPNALGVILVAATLRVGLMILVESALSFLGLGIQPPTASWGTIINDGRDALLDAWWIATFPGLAIVFTVVSFNLVGEGLKENFDRRG